MPSTALHTISSQPEVMLSTFNQSNPSSPIAAEPTEQNQDSSLLYAAASKRTDDAFSLVRLVRFILSSAITSAIVVFGVWLPAYVLGRNPDRPEVNKDTCDCTCWDGRFKGSYGSNGYKSVYFNFDGPMVLIAFWLFFVISLLKNVVSRALDLIIVDLNLVICGNINTLGFFGIGKHMIKKRGNNVTVERLSWVILFIFVVSAYSNFYGAWVLLNYFNDRDTRMLNSQIFYVFTEFIPSYIYFLCLAKPVNLTRTGHHTKATKLDSNADVEEGQPLSTSPPTLNDRDAEKEFIADSSTQSFFSVAHVPVHYIYPIFTVALVHMMLAMPEGMLNTTFSKHNVGLRDLGLMSTDFLGVLFSAAVALESRKARRGGSKRGQRAYMKIWAGIGVSLWIFYKLFCAFD